MSLYHCPCGRCGETVEVTFPGGFDGVTCEVEPCSIMQAAGVASYTVRRSAPLGWTVAGEAAVRHQNGLVTFG